VIHVYGIVDELDSLPPLEGLDDAPLERRRVDDLELVVSEVPREEVTQEAVLRHAEVVEALMSRSRALLPAQFSRPFSGDEELVSAVTAKAPELGQRLHRVRGCVELGLRVVAPKAETVPEAKSGAEYLRARLDEEHRRSQLVAQLDEPLARLSQETAGGAAGSDVFERAYLVRAEDVPAFIEAVRELEAANPELSLACTGPWPPYSFGAETAK
jgi:Gas vesicle synthesis protein GvpL/GvpF